MKLNTLFEGFSKQIYSNSNESSDDDSALAASSTKTLLKTENEKYRMLLDDLIEWKGHTLYRIQYKVDIRNKNNFTIASKDYRGGYIESLDNLSEKGICVVKNKAKVWGNARVYEDAWVSGNAEVYGDAQVCGRTLISGNAEVYGDAQVCGHTIIGGNSQVYCHASGSNKDINNEYH